MLNHYSININTINLIQTQKTNITNKEIKPKIPNNILFNIKINQTYKNICQ